MAKRFGLDHLSLEDITVDPVAAHMVSFAAARRMRVVPVSVASGNVLLVAIANPENYLGLDDISMFTGMQIKPVVVSQEDLDTLLKRLSVLDGELVQDEIANEPKPQDVTQFESPDDAPTIKLVRSIVSEAVDRGVSDIHFAPDDGALTVRFRIDGVMADAARVPAQPGRGGDLADQDPRGPRHLGEAPAPGRPDRHRDRGPARSTSGLR